MVVKAKLGIATHLSNNAHVEFISLKFGQKKTRKKQKKQRVRKIFLNFQNPNSPKDIKIKIQKRHI
ncbi:hypothetical protein JP0101_15030 [Helicobacter pylori]|nr:hypothetical protein JP0101_15030 [Helicobacter pylori]